MREFYLVYSRPDHREAYLAFGRGGFGSFSPLRVGESFLLHGSDPRFPNVDPGSWCLVVVANSTPSIEGFRLVGQEASAAEPEPIVAECLAVAANMQTLTARLVAGLSSVDGME